MLVRSVYHHSHNHIKTITDVLAEKNQSKNLYTCQTYFMIWQNYSACSSQIREDYNVLQTEVAMPANKHLDR